MDRLPESLLLQILSRLDDSADVACCRVASKAFNAVFPDLRSINLRCSKEWYVNSRSRVSTSKPPFMAVFLHLISQLDAVESVSIIHEDPVSVLLTNDLANDDLYLHNMYAEEWLPRVSDSLKSISFSGIPYSKILPLISAHCHNLVNLNLNYAWLPVANLNPMPMLTTLTLEYTILEDQHLNEFNRGFPNLRVLNLVRVGGLTDPRIHLLNLQTCYWASNHPPSLTIIAPNLTTLEIEIECPAAIHVEAPVLSHFNLRLNTLRHAGAFNVKKFENLKTLCLVSLCLGVLLSEFPITKTVETLTLDSENEEPRDTTDSDLTIRKVFMVFPNVSSLCIYPGAWWELEACCNPEGWEILDGRKGLKTICAYLDLVDPEWTFSSLFCVLYKCVGLSQVSLLIHCDVVDTESKSFMSKCMDRWPGLNWRWGTWGEHMEDSWITEGISS